MKQGNKILLTAVLVASLVACMSPTADMMNNQYMNVTPMLSKNEMVGIWSGSVGPFAVTYKIEKDGTGLSCSSWNGKDTLEKIKINDKKMISQGGMTQTIVNVDVNELVLKMNYLGSGKYTFKPDPELKGASPYCESQFK